MARGLRGQRRSEPDFAKGHFRHRPSALRPCGRRPPAAPTRFTTLGGALTHQGVATLTPCVVHPLPASGGDGRWVNLLFSTHYRLFLRWNQQHPSPRTPTDAVRRLNRDIGGKRRKKEEGAAAAGTDL